MITLVYNFGFLVGVSFFFFLVTRQILWRIVVAFTRHKNEGGEWKKRKKQRVTHRVHEKRRRKHVMDEWESYSHWSNFTKKSTRSWCFWENQKERFRFSFLWYGKINKPFQRPHTNIKDLNVHRRIIQIVEIKFDW